MEKKESLFHILVLLNFSPTLFWDFLNFRAMFKRESVKNAAFYCFNISSPKYSYTEE